MAPREAKVKKGKPPPVDKLLLPAIGIALALLAYQFLKGLGTDVSVTLEQPCQGCVRNRFVFGFLKTMLTVLFSVLCFVVVRYLGSMWRTN